MAVVFHIRYRFEKETQMYYFGNIKIPPKQNMILIFLVLIGISSASRIDPNLHPSLKIAGNKKLSDCVNGGLLSTSDLDITTTEFIRKEGYPAEEHVVLTEDGYYLTMHRIPGRPNDTPVFLQHGIVCSSYDWVVSGKGKGLAFILADQGYDVWLGNFRGNPYSRCHTKYDAVQQTEYWNFSWHEFGIYDIPADITYITDLTNQKVIYIGHSMGTTASYVMAIERPDIASRIKALFSLSPVAYLTNGQSLFLSFIKLLYDLDLLVKETDFMYPTPAVRELVKNVCFGSLPQKKFCINSLFVFLGFGVPPPFYADYYYKMVPKILSHTPAGTGTKILTHYAQVRLSDHFQHFDYGSEENLRRYNNSTPPEYDISKITLPVGLLWSENDPFVHPTDQARFSEQLPNRILDYKVKLPQFNHVDVMWAEDAFDQIYSQLLSAMENFR